MSSAALDVTTYRWARAYGVRLLGAFAVIFGVLVVVAGVAGFPYWALVALICVGAGMVVGVIRFLGFPPRLLELSSGGYQVRSIRGAGTKAAAWKDVENVETRSTPHGPALTLQLTDGRTSTVPLSLLGPRAVEAQREIHERLNLAYGYRPLDPS